MYIYEKEIKDYQKKGYVLMDVLDIDLFKNKLAIHNYNYLENTKNELKANGLDLNHHDLKDSLNKYINNKSLENTIFLFKESYVSKGLIYQHLKNIHTEKKFIPIYLTSLFFKENYLQVFESIESIRQMDSLEKLERLFLSNEKREGLYKFLMKKNNLDVIKMYLIDFLYDEERMEKLLKLKNISDNEKEFLIYKKIKVEEFLKCLLFLSKKEINTSLVNNLVYSLYYYELNFLFNALLIDFEDNMNDVFNYLRITKDYKRKDIMITFHEIVETYEKYNKVYELIELSKIMKRKFLVNENDLLDVVFVID